MSAPVYTKAQLEAAREWFAQRVVFEQERALLAVVDAVLGLDPADERSMNEALVRAGEQWERMPGSDSTDALGYRAGERHVFAQLGAVWLVEP